MNFEGNCVSIIQLREISYEIHFEDDRLLTTGLELTSSLRPHFQIWKRPVGGGLKYYNLFCIVAFR